MLPPLVPPRLRRGDRIGVVTPSWPLSMSPSPDPKAELERGLDTLRRLGFDPVLAENALADLGYQAGPPEARAADINRMFADASVRAIIASHGGQVAYGVLRHLDWEAIRQQPKVFMGFSNIDPLLMLRVIEHGLAAADEFDQLELRGGSHDDRLEEFADVLAWLATIANVAEVDLTEAVARKYGAGCPGCRQSPCVCDHAEKP